MSIICGKICGSHKNSVDIRSERSTSPRTRYEGARGIARHVRARQGRDARLTGRMEHVPEQLS